MTRETKLVGGAILLSVPSIIFGGYFLLTILSGQQEHLGLTEFQKAMFRAGHAHAGVLVMLSLIAQLFADHAKLSISWNWFARLAFPLAAILVSMGFFAAATGEGLEKPNSLVVVIYIGAIVLAAGLLTLGIGLVKKEKQP